MLREMLQSKLHHATVTDTRLTYAGSLTIDMDLVDRAKMLPYQKIQLVNSNNGHRLETYIITGEPGSGTVCLNGPAARLGQKGDIIIALTYAQMTDEEAKSFLPKVVHVDGWQGDLRSYPPTYDD